MAQPIRGDADPEWQAIHSAADAEQPAFTRFLLAALEALAARTVLLRLRSALRLRDVEQAIQAVPVATLLTTRPEVERVLLDVATRGAVIGQRTELIVRLGSRAGLPVADLAYWARTRSAALVAGITDQTRRGLRAAIAQAITDGLSAPRAAKLVETVIGLNTVQVTALLNRATALREAGATAEQITAALARYAAQLLKQRARVIARHELMNAANAGRRLQWANNVRDGLIVPDRWEREWVAIVPSDGRTCAYCEGQDGQRAPILGAYPDGSSGPPGHPLCRCTEVLVRRA